MNVAVNHPNSYRNKIHPKKFALWTACISISMMFAAFSSAYIVRMAQGNWLEFPLPNWFYVSTATIILSSLTLHGSYWAFKKMKTGLYRALMLMSFVLGCLFIYFQYLGYHEMTAMGAHLTANPSSSFIFVISWVHIAHLVGGLGVLIVAMLHAFMLEHKVTPARKLRFELTYTYWHFVDILWIYLLLFFILQQQS